MLLFFIAVTAFCEGWTDKFAYSDYGTPTRGLKVQGEKVFGWRELDKCEFFYDDEGEDRYVKYYMNANYFTMELWNSSDCYTGELLYKSSEDVRHTSLEAGDLLPRSVRFEQEPVTERVISVDPNDIATVTTTGSYTSFEYAPDGESDCVAKTYSKVVDVQINVLGVQAMEVCFTDDMSNRVFVYYDGQVGHDQSFNHSYSYIDADASGFLYTTYSRPQPYVQDSCVSTWIEEGPYDLNNCDPMNPFLGVSESLVGPITEDLTDIPDGFLYELDEQYYYFPNYRGDSVTDASDWSIYYEDGHCQALIEDEVAGYASLARCEIDISNKCDWAKCDYAEGGDGPAGWIKSFEVTAASEECIDDLPSEAAIQARWVYDEDVGDLSKAAEIQLSKNVPYGCMIDYEHADPEPLSYKFICDTFLTGDFYRMGRRTYLEDCITPVGLIDYDVFMDGTSVYCVRDTNFPFVCDVCPAECTGCKATSVCTGCEDGFWLSGGVCQNCPAECTVCSAFDICSGCEEEYFLNGDECLDCGLDNCRTCPGDICSDCIDGYYFDVSVCRSCIVDFCAVCDGGECSNCLEGYYLVGSDTCEDCTVDECSVCPGDICEDCSEGYFFHNDACITCDVEDCETCTGTACTDCAADYFLYDGECQTCDVEDCETCTGTDCTTCDDGFFPVGDECLSCDIDRCAECDDEFCGTCDPGYHVVGGTECVINNCNVNFCVICDDDICSECGSEYFLVGSTACVHCTLDDCNDCPGDTCTTCNNGYFLVDDTCVTCNVVDCETCTGTECTTCITGYEIDDDGECVEEGDDNDDDVVDDNSSIVVLSLLALFVVLF